ncbi:M48 family metalloprotease [Nakamurella aerolata]|uniref:M48 family metallopeptidase n=1 Tax=Nakamurella aerolata TaxID=1656892 RepID=A0A849A5A8_9ACTN|nr:M48 family metallopeptidase [Nakamurella aerolata]
MAEQRKRASKQPAKVDGRVRFPGISPRAYEHPADRGVMATMRAVPGLADILKTLSGIFPERGERLMALASCIRVGDKQYPQLEKIRQDCAAILDLPTVPNVFVHRDPYANAMTIGIDEPFILINTGLVEALDDDALRFVIGHEMGHVLSGHAVLRTLLIRLLSLQTTIAWVPAGALGLRAVIAALREWFRKAELTADRAGLLTVQDPKAALRAHVYLAGGIESEQIDIPSFLRQAEEYTQVEDIRDSIHKLRAVEGMTHPLAVVRAAQLQKWAASEDYRAILGGTYPKREDDTPQKDLGEDMSSAARSYKTAAEESTDPLTNLINTVGDQLAKAGSRLGGMFKQDNGSADGAPDGGKSGKN